MWNEIYRILKKVLFYVVAAGIVSMTVFFIAGIIFPHTAYDKSKAAVSQSAMNLAAEKPAKVSAAAAGKTSPAKASAAKDDGSVPAMAVADNISTVPSASPSPSPAASTGASPQKSALDLNAGSDEKPSPSASPSAGNTTAANTDTAAIASTASAASASPSASDTVKPSPSASPTDTQNNGDTDQPPSLLEIISRSIFSYKTLLSHEMPFIYGTDYIADNVDQLDESETAPEEISNDIKLEINKIDKDSKNTEMELPKTGVQVLIYHTHTQEAYRQTDSSKYVACGSWRTKDQSKNVVEVGDILQTEMQKLGYVVVHDKTNHEPPELNSAYSRSLATMKKYKAKYKTLQVYIDLHRDASSNKDDVVMIDGKRCAKVMFVVGMGNSSSIKPDWKNSYKLADAITDKLNDIKSGLCHNVRVKEIRSYNQYMSNMCMLVEVGHNGNTLEEANNTIPYLAKAISQVIKLQS